MYNIINIINSVCMLYRKLIKRVSPEFPSSQINSFSVSLKKKSYLQRDIHNVIYNNQHMKTILVSIGEWLEKEVVINIIAMEYYLAI